jgi:hypothetical protein
MPFTFFKGQPWRAQVAFIGSVVLILVAISIVAAQI